jgi:gliding motility-associated-like protein
LLTIKEKVRFIILISTFHLPGFLMAQILVSHDVSIVITSSAIVNVNGGTNFSGGELINDGTLKITKNSNFPNPGDFEISDSNNTSGNGLYKIEKNWINNAFFECSNSTVELYGNAEQYITSDLGTSTLFHNLVLTGNGESLNRRKTLQNVDCKINNTGSLILNDRELNTNIQRVIIENPSPFAITNSLTYQDEGFISSLSPGFTQWTTVPGYSYTFPVGSSDGTRRYRSVFIQPLSNETNPYQVRFNNYSSNGDSYIQTSVEKGLYDLNPLFYHTISRYNESSSLLNIGIAYDHLFDGAYSQIAAWHLNENKWKTTTQNNSRLFGNYKMITSENWIMTENFKPYILSNYSQDVVIFAPNTFVPDGDGVNDVFEVVFSPEAYCDIIDFNVFNRWGELIHKSNGTATWDGTYKGLKCQGGTYTWTIKYKDLILNRNFSFTGHINLLK